MNAKEVQNAVQETLERNLRILRHDKGECSEVLIGGDWHLVIKLTTLEELHKAAAANLAQALGDL